MVSTPSMTAQHDCDMEYFDLDFSVSSGGGEVNGVSGYNLALDSPVFGYQDGYRDGYRVDGGMQDQDASGMGMYTTNLNPYQGMGGMNGMSLWQ